MKKLTIEISDDAHLELLELQLKKKRAKEERTTIREVAGAFLTEKLLEQKEKPAK